MNIDNDAQAYQEKPCIFDHSDRLILIHRMQGDGTSYDYCQGCGWVDAKSLLTAQRQALRDEIMKAIGGGIGWEWKPYNEIDDVTSCGLDPKEFEFKVCTVCREHEFHPESVHICEAMDKERAELRTAISTIFEEKK